MRQIASRLAAIVFLLAAAIPAAAQQRAPLRGDVNGDGRVSAADAQAVLAHLRGRSLPAGFDVAGRGDADGDGRITRADAELITRFASGQNVAQLPVGRPAELPVPSGTTVLECRGNPATRALVCSAPAVGGSPDLLYGGQNRFTTLTSSGISVYADTFAFDVTVKNLIPQPIGTTNGRDPDPNGVRVFFAGGVQNTSASAGSIEVGNADGVATFTAADQPFFRYAEVLAPGATSSARRWKLRFDPGVETFSFRLYLSSPVQFPDGWVDVAPGTLALASGDSALLADTVRNAYGMVIDTATVTWTTSDPAIATVDAAGRVAAVGDGAATITATSGPRVGRASVVVSTASAGTSRLAATPATLAVHDTTVVTLTVLNGAGQPVTRGGAAVTFATTLGTLGAVTDNGNGTYSAPLTAPSVGAARVSATLAGRPVSDTADVAFTAAAPASYVVTSSTLAPAAGSTVTITAALRDAYGNAVTGVARSVTWSSTGGGSFSAPASAVDSAGIATVRFTTATAAGTTHAVTAADSTGTTGSVTLVTVTGAASTLAANDGDGQSAVAGSAVATPPSVRVTDSAGNPVPGATVTFAVAHGGGSATGTTQTTDSLGIARVESWTLGTTAGAGSDSLRASVTGLADFTFSASATAGPPAAITRATADSATATVGSAVTPPPSVTITDSYGNPVAGVTVAFTADSASGTVAGGSPTTDSLGVATVGSWTLRGTPGINTLTVTAGSLTTTFTATGTVGAPSPATTRITAADSTLASDSSTVVTVRVSDALGNAVATGGATVALTTTLGTLGDVADNGDGSYTATLTHTGTAGTATVSGTLNGVAIGDSATVEFAGGSGPFTWTGTVSDDWSVPGNWSRGAVPTAGDTVVISGAVATQPRITDGNKAVLRMEMTDGATLALGGYTLTIGGDLVAPTGTVSDGTVEMSGTTRTISGTVPALWITGSTATSAPTRTTAAVSVSGGALTVAGQAFTISIP